MTIESIMNNCLPLEVEESGVISDKDGIGFGEFCGFTTDELKYIVNAINSHDKLVDMIKTLIGNYQVAASIADHEGYKTRYDQDSELVKLLLAELENKHD